MALSHLIQLKPRSLLCKIGLSQPMKWRSSSTYMSTTVKKKTALRGKASSVESFVNKYMEMHQGIFGTVTLGQNEIGRSFHSMKDIMLNLKSKIIGKPAAACQNNGPNKCEVVSSESNALSDGSNFFATITEKSNESLTVETEDMDGTTKDIKICSKINENAQEDNIKDVLKSIDALNEPLQLDPNLKSASTQTRNYLEQFDTEMKSSTGCQSHQPDNQADSVVLPNIVLEVGALSCVSTESAKKAISLKELFKKRTDYLETGEMKTEIKTEILTRKIFKDTSTEAQEKVAKDSNLSGLINSLKKHPHGENKRKETLLNGQITIEKKEKEHGLDVQVPHNNIKSTLSTKISPLTNKKAESSVKPLLNENKAILRFLPLEMKEDDIAIAFKNRHNIVKIECSSVKGSMFKTAQVCFKTKDGLKEALKTRYLTINFSTITIEAASALDSLSKRICIPNLIDDPDAPAMLLKNPSKTVMIKGLTDDISSHHIQEALLPFSKREISAFFFGSSSSVAYVEFKTEEGKERALAEQSIVVEGKPLSIFRVDSPRTTVIRITHVSKTINCGRYKALKDIVKLCKSYGEVKIASPRNLYNTDVHFCITEWPNMLKILNGLNGQIVDGDRFQARPADVYPPEVIHALWGHPEERKRLKGLMRNLFRKFEEDYVDKTDILDLAARYYRDDEEA